MASKHRDIGLEFRHRSTPNTRRVTKNVGFGGGYHIYIFPLKSIEYGVYGDLLILHPKPNSTYLRGTVSQKTSLALDSKSQERSSLPQRQSTQSPEVPKALRVQVPNRHILIQNLYCNYYSPKPKHLIFGYLDPKPYPYIALHIPFKGNLILGYLDPLGSSNSRG